MGRAVVLFLAFCALFLASVWILPSLNSEVVGTTALRYILIISLIVVTALLTRIIIAWWAYSWPEKLCILVITGTFEFLLFAGYSHYAGGSIISFVKQAMSARRIEPDLFDKPEFLPLFGTLWQTIVLSVVFLAMANMIKKRLE